MFLLSVTSYFDRTIMAIAGPGIMKEFRLTETQIGSIYSAFIFAYALVMIPGGYFSDRYGPRLTLSAMGLGAGLFTGLTALAARPGLGTYLGIVPAFWMVRFGMGTFTAPLYPACGKMNANWFPLSKRALVWGLVAAGAGLGSAISPLLFSCSLEHYGWRISFLFAGLQAVILALVWLWYARDHPSEHPALLAGSEGSSNPPRGEAVWRNRKTPWRRLLTNQNLLLLTLGYAAVGYFEYIFFFWIYYYCGHIRHWSSAQSELYTTAIFLTWTVMSPLGGWVSDRLVERYGHRTGRRLVPIVGLPAAALCLCAGINLDSPLVAGVVLSLAFGLAAFADGPFWAAVIDLAGRESGAACGILNTGANLGGTFGPVLTPFIASFAGWSVGLYFGCLVLMVAVVAWLLLDPNRATI